jgi:hypothetical protein
MRPWDALPVWPFFFDLEETYPCFLAVDASDCAIESLEEPSVELIWCERLAREHLRVVLVLLVRTQEVLGKSRHRDYLVK